MKVLKIRKGEDEKNYQGQLFVNQVLIPTEVELNVKFHGDLQLFTVLNALEWIVVVIYLSLTIIPQTNR